jgi:arginyl-tRNA synthetase
MRQMKDYLRERIDAAVESMGVAPGTVEIQFEKPKQADHGDVSTNVAMMLSRELKQKPRDIAVRLVEAARASLDPTLVTVDDPAGPGFINFRYTDHYVQSLLGGIVEAGDRYGRAETNAGKRVNVEWVSANPTGPLHAGHGRQVCIGETLCALLEWTGFDVTREYYFNNAGNQMNALGETVRERYREQLGLETSQENIHYVGEYVREIAKEIADEFGGTKLDAGLDFFRRRGEEWCFAVIKRTLDDIGVHHDVFYNEDSLYSEGKIDGLITELREKDLVYESESALWLRTTAFGTDKDRVVVKSTGEPTYRLPDIAYHKEKILSGYDRIIDIFGADHIATYPDVLAALSALGYDISHIDVIIHQMVSFVNEGEAVKMSKRSGNVYFLDELIRDVGRDAVRYFFIMRGAQSHLEFDVKLAQEQSESNPVYYLQYAHARIASILRFAEGEGYALRKGPDVALLAHSSELALMRSLLEFPETVSYCARTYEIQHLCTYLHGVATDFHRFYHDCRVVTEDRTLSEARLYLCSAVMQVLKNGLSLLGVTAPERM